MTYIRNLWHDIKDACSHFVYLRRYLRRGGNPDHASF